MNRKCRLKSCRRPLPPVAKSDGIEQIGFCCRDHSIQHGREKAQKWSQRAVERKKLKPAARTNDKPGWRSEKYLKWVRKQKCCACGGAGGEAHHIIGVGADLSGMGMTAPDQFAMSLCPQHHRQIHQDPAMQQRQWEWIARCLARAVEEGVI